MHRLTCRNHLPSWPSWLSSPAIGVCSESGANFNINTARKHMQVSCCGGGGCFKTASRFKVFHPGIAAVLGDYAEGTPHICTTWHLKAFIAFMAFIAFIACCSQVPQAMAPSKPAMHEPMQDPARMCHQAWKETTSETLPRDSLQQPGKQSVQHGCSVPCGPSLPSCSSSRELPRHPPSSSWPLATVAKASTDHLKDFSFLSRNCVAKLAMRPPRKLENLLQPHALLMQAKLDDGNETGSRAFMAFIAFMACQQVEFEAWPATAEASIICDGFPRLKAAAKV